MLNFRFWIEGNSVNLPLSVLIQNLSGLVRSRKSKQLVFFTPLPEAERAGIEPTI
ncbi:hypothetical protein MC7420_4616 [Coleofasciculus chthonoplastes PCC 7420]|uniref:Uncharacterized protein n=1 Tax=Coleofasciculus chthonoplastes PCC 7420 TaxID=118168 RepID=B4VN83_9CYAN|nr:hypothetical protein [Coleofasciculus chthonoplastes]EDX76360.1 hypothetical protein MC7420_4616 [Coleofasciculus chthonoplastes PCC 7420]